MIRKIVYTDSWAANIIACVLAIAAGILVPMCLEGCYPKNCDPKTDPLKCQCPDGPCGPYPGIKDAGADG